VILCGTPWTLCWKRNVHSPSLSCTPLMTAWTKRLWGPVARMTRQGFWTDRQNVHMAVNNEIRDWISKLYLWWQTQTLNLKNPFISRIRCTISLDGTYRGMLIEKHKTVTKRRIYQRHSTKCVEPLEEWFSNPPKSEAPKTGLSALPMTCYATKVLQTSRWSATKTYSKCTFT